MALPRLSQRLRMPIRRKRPTVGTLAATGKGFSPLPGTKKAGGLTPIQKGMKTSTMKNFNAMKPEIGM